MRRPDVSVTLASLVGSARALAQDGTEYGSGGAPISWFLATSDLSRNLVREQLLRAGPVARPGRGPSTITTGSSQVAHLLARAYPADERAHAERLFRHLFQGYAQIEDTVGVEPGDLAGATAVFVIAAFEAYRDTDLDRSAYGPVIEQLRGLIQASPEFAAASASARREIYEHMAILGTFVLALRAQLRAHPEPTARGSLRSAAKAYLWQFLNVDPERLHISGAGIAIQQPPAARDPTPTRAATGAAGASPPLGPDLAARNPAVPATAEIATVGLYARMEVGFNGALLQKPTPIVLFNSGEALLEMAHLCDRAGLEANRRSHPGDWTTWRRNGAAIERLEGSHWSKLEWTTCYDRLPPGFVLEGRYHCFSGGAIRLATASSSIASWQNLWFERSGRFTIGGGMVSTTGRVTSRAQAPSADGSYEISGYTLTLRYDDGRTADRVIVADPADTRVIWIDGAGYTRD